MDNLLTALAFGAGGLLAVQAGANAQLAKATASPFAATTLQLSVGSAVLFFLTLVTGTMSALLALPGAAWWHTIGGTASAFYVVSTILLFPRLGAVVSVGLIIAGQMLASLVLDSLGLLGITGHGFAIGATLGTLDVLAGAALSLASLGWFALALLAGAVLPVQGAVNALLRHDLGGASFAVGATSFMVATFAMAAVLILSLALPQTPRPHLQGVPAMPWWAWLGGLAGATYVTTVFTAIPVIGAAAAVGLTVAGQQVASIFVDIFGWFRLPQRPVSAVRLLGVLLLLTGVVIIKLI